MSEDAKPRKLTPNDPVDAETLAQFSKLDSARIDLAMRLMEIEQDRVRLLSAAHTVDQQTRRLFEKVLVDRGFPPTAPIDIDPTTGQIKVRAPAPQEPPAAPE